MYGKRSKEDFVSDNLLFGGKLGRYNLINRIGKGGMAWVFSGFDTNLDRTVAIKVMYPHLSEDPTFKERFEQEAKFVAGFNHPNIVKVYDFNSYTYQNQHVYYMVMPYITGKTLQQILSELNDENKIMPDWQVQHIITRVADALNYAHERGMVHRDVKPANIIFDENNEPILTDFGIARLIATSNLTQEGVTVGTPAYMSPEQATGELVDARSDIYALGTILYEMLTGQPPFNDDGSISVLLKHVHEKHPTLSTHIDLINPDLEKIIDYALAKEPSARYQSALDLAEDLENVFQGKPIRVHNRQTNASQTQPFESVIPAINTGSDKDRSSTLVIIVTEQLKTISKSPLRILFIGLAVIGLFAIIGAIGQITNNTTESNDNSTITVDSMTGPLYFKSDFELNEDNLQYWQTNSDNFVERQIIDGQFSITSQMPSRATTTLFSEDYTYKTSTIVMNATLDEESSPASGYGIIFRYQDPNNYYVFAVDGQQRYSIWIRENGEWYELRSFTREDDEWVSTGNELDLWTYHEAINPIAESNTLSVDIASNRFIGLVNGVQVTNIREETFEEGAVGIYLASSDTGIAKILVDNYQILLSSPSMTNPLIDNN